MIKVVNGINPDYETFIYSLHLQMVNPKHQLTLESTWEHLSLKYQCTNQWNIDNSAEKSMISKKIKLEQIENNVDNKNDNIFLPLRKI